MESLPSKKRVLFIVEGKKAEVNFIKRMADLNGLSFETVSVCANIHMLYRFLEKEGFHFNIVDAILEMKGVSKEDKEKLKTCSSFAYTYLIFDLDLQHYDISIPENIERGLREAREMAEYFQDETDPTVGKLYINYPMIESYRDCADFFDEGYREKSVEVRNFVHYKQIVSERGIQKNVSAYEKQNYCDLMRMNLYKGNFICNGAWQKPSYEDYRNTISQTNIVSRQSELVKNTDQVSVLNGACFILIDYFGNKNGYFDGI